ncbi:MAG TPA: hypothetical protein VMX18_00495 [Candidatus Bipolaricaulota bacterium]|nr:hypothetical protein [Candidatus Bipolaricaulota bacterium]
MKKSNLKWILLAVAVIIAAALIYFLAIKGVYKKEIYENSRYQYSLNYPADWTLGAEETNNAGREIFSPDKKVYCYVYGFENALVNDNGEPQTIDEFSDWLVTASKELSTEEEPINLLTREATKLDGWPAMKMSFDEGAIVREAVYTLGKSTGLGFFCVYPTRDDQTQYGKDFEKMYKSIAIKSDLDGAGTNAISCANLLGGATTPLKGKEVFYDTAYTEVTMTGREDWDQDRLPLQVVQLEPAGYECYPMPFEFSDSSPDDVNAQPEVTKVEWTCELPYEEWGYVAFDDENEKAAQEKEGLVCKQDNCMDENSALTSIWFCSK